MILAGIGCIASFNQDCDSPKQLRNSFGGSFTGMRVATLTPDKEAEWDAFVVACPQATFFHRAGWKAVIESLGHDTHYLYAEVDGRIDGVLPLGHMQSRLFGNALVS